MSTIEPDGKTTGPSVWAWREDEELSVQVWLEDEEASVCARGGKWGAASVWRGWVSIICCFLLQVSCKSQSNLQQSYFVVLAKADLSRAIYSIDAKRLLTGYPIRASKMCIYRPNSKSDPFFFQTRTEYLSVLREDSFDRIKEWKRGLWHGWFWLAVVNLLWTIIQPGHRKFIHQSQLHSSLSNLGSASFFIFQSERDCMTSEKKWNYKKIRIHCLIFFF